MPENQDFDPRRAALRYAGRTFPHRPAGEPDLAEATNAITCALVYIGDQLAAITACQGESSDALSASSNSLSAIANLLETLDATLSNGLAAVEAGL